MVKGPQMTREDMFTRILVAPGSLIPLTYEGTFDGGKWKDGRLISRYGLLSYAVLDGIPIFVEQPIDEQRINAYLRNCEDVWGKEHRVVRDVSNLYYWSLFSKEAAESGNVVMDVASGEEGGFIKGILRVNPEASVMMNDIDYAPLRAWQLFFRKRNIAPNVCFAVFDASNMPIKSNSVDAVTSVLGFVSALKYDGRALRETYRVMKPGGKLLLLEWLKREEDLLEIGSKLPRKELDEWIRTFPMFPVGAVELGNLLEDIGFKVELYKEVGKRPLIRGRDGLADIAEEYGLKIQATLYAIKAVK